MVENKNIRLVDIIGLLGGRTRIAVYISEIDKNGHRSDYTKPEFEGCVDEDFSSRPKPTWTSDNKKIEKIRNKYANYYVLNMNVYDDLQDQTLNIWIAENQEI